MDEESTFFSVGLRRHRASYVLVFWYRFVFQYYTRVSETFIRRLLLLLYAFVCIFSKKEESRRKRNEIGGVCHWEKNSFHYGWIVVLLKGKHHLTFVRWRYFSYQCLLILSRPLFFRKGFTCPPRSFSYLWHLSFLRTVFETKNKGPRKL